MGRHGVRGLVSYEAYLQRRDRKAGAFCCDLAFACDCARHVAMILPGLSSHTVELVRGHTLPTLSSFTGCRSSGWACQHSISTTLAALNMVSLAFRASAYEFRVQLVVYLLYILHCLCIGIAIEIYS